MRLKNRLSSGRERLVELQAGALDRAGDLLERAPEVRGLSRLSGAARKLVETRLDKLTAVPVEGWDEMNARTASKTARECTDRALLVALRRREAVTKDRKTVLAAIDQQLDKLDTPTSEAA